MQHPSLPDRYYYYDDTLRAHGGVMGVLKALVVLASVAAGISGVAGFRNADSINHPFVRMVSSMEFQRGLQDVNAECTLDCCTQYEEDICVSDDNASDDSGWISAIPFGIQITLVVILLMLSALFSGLTLGLMSLDLTGLEIVMSGDDARSAQYAKRIYTIRTNGNLLLCTLVFGNVAVNAVISILMANYTGGLVGVLSSTFLIVIFGEITPQAAGARFPLVIGNFSVPIMKCVIVIFYPVTKPLSMALDFVLGQELATTYSNGEMTKLLQIHVRHNAMDHETAQAMTGALTYKQILVKEVMTPMERTFLLDVDEKLSFETMAKIFKSGYSRIPVYEVARDNIIGLLFVKDLIFIDPADEVPIKNFIQIFGRAVHLVWPDDNLGDVLPDLKKGRSHLAIVRDVHEGSDSKDPYYVVKGIITLEDIIEKIIGDNIVDETDEYTDSTRNIKVDREVFEWARLRLLDTKLVDELLSPNEANAVAAHFRMNYPETVQLLTDTQLTRLVANTPISTLATANHSLGNELPDDLLYQKGAPSDTCTLILGGKVTVLVGAENFRSDLSSWAIMGISALEKSDFCPDFTAFVSDGPCRCLRLTRAAFAAAVDASAIEKSTICISPVLPPSPTMVASRRDELLARLSSTDVPDSPIAVKAQKSPAVVVESDESPAVVVESDESPPVVVDSHQSPSVVVQASDESEVDETSSRP